MHDLSDDTPDRDKPRGSVYRTRYHDVSLPTIQRIIRVTINARMRWDSDEAEVDFAKWHDDGFQWRGEVNMDAV